MAADDPYLKTAFSIGAEICRHALWWEDRCNWIGDAPGGGFSGRKKLAAASLNADLYNGTAGLAVFLAELSVRTNDDYFRHHALGAARNTAHLIRNSDDEALDGLYHGRTGSAFGLLTVGERLRCDEFLDQGRNVLEKVLRNQSTIVGNDVISGAAGTILGVDALARHANPSLLTEFRLRQTRHLLTTAQESPEGLSWPTRTDRPHPHLAGYSHGVAGIIAALAVANRTLRSDEITRAIREGLRYESNLFVSDVDNWPDLREADSSADQPAVHPCMTAWCHGAPGILMARLQLRNADPAFPCDDNIAAAIRCTIANLKQHRVNASGNYSLCHGNAGNADILISASHLLNRPDCLKAARSTADFGCERYGGARQAWPPGYQAPGYSPSLMVGLAGAGYFYLRASDPSNASLLGIGL